MAVFKFPDSPPPPPPKNVLRATFFHVVGTTQRPLVCAAYEVESGLELRLFYSDVSDDSGLMRSQLFRGVDADDRLATAADQWRRALVGKGFTEQE